MSRLTTHILDTSTGKPAAGVTVLLLEQDGMKEITKGITNKDGRITDWLHDKTISPGIYKLVFETGEYFGQSGQSSFYPVVEIVVNIGDDAHYHIPLLLSPFGYSTYRGS